MYIPQHHLEENIAVIHQLIKRYNFGTLIYQSSKGSQALHVPFLLDLHEDHHNKNKYGILKAHVNKQNFELELLNNQQELLIIFSGPHGYISPAWYDRSTAPTWDFIKIHAYGRGQFVEPKELLNTLDALIKASENNIGNPWNYISVTDSLPDIYLEKMLPKIVGLEVRIDRLECQVKLSQERTPKERAQIIQGLLSGKDPLSQQLIEFIGGCCSNSR